jgi:hypothetical protein
VEVYPDRASVPRELWLRLLGDAREGIDVLVCAGTFLGQVQPRLGRLLADRASVGVRVRLCFADPDCDAVAVRDREQGLGGTLPALVRASLTRYRDLSGVDGCQVRLHATTLYASVFRFDDQVIANPHAYGEPGDANPAFHFLQVEGGGLFEHYAASFERVWSSATPWPAAG